MLKENQLYCMDAIEFMKQVDDKVIDLILTDLPYGTTACEWDVIIPLDKLWEQFKRILKDNGVVVLTASQPFTTDLINSNRDWFKYCWVWDKGNVTGFMNVKKIPMKQHEDIVIFYKIGKYNPQKEIIDKNDYRYNKNGRQSKKSKGVYGKTDANKTEESCERYPKSIIKFINSNSLGKIHPTQKPVALFKYLIKTYTQEGDLVLDCCVGSGTTAVACKQTDRRFLCNDNNPTYIEISNQRLNQTNLNTFSDTTETLNEFPSLNTDLIQFASQTKSANADFPTEN